jgi:hypothetical protein
MHANAQERYEHTDKGFAARGKTKQKYAGHYAGPSEDIGPEFERLANEYNRNRDSSIPRLSAHQLMRIMEQDEAREKKRDEIRQTALDQALDIDTVITDADHSR